jgi:hypothetical protein
MESLNQTLRIKLTLVLSFLAVIVTLALLSASKQISPRIFGIAVIASAALFAILWFAVLRNASREYLKNRELTAHSIGANTQELIRKNIRGCTSGVIVLQLALWSGLWMARRQPLAPVLVGVTVNLCFTATFIWAIYLGRKSLRLLNPNDDVAASKGSN